MLLLLSIGMKPNFCFLYTQKNALGVDISSSTTLATTNFNFVVQPSKIQPRTPQRCSGCVRTLWERNKSARERSPTPPTRKKHFHLPLKMLLALWLWEYDSMEKAYKDYAGSLLESWTFDGLVRLVLKKHCSLLISTVHSWFPHTNSSRFLQTNEANKTCSTLRSSSPSMSTSHSSQNLNPVSG